MRILVLTSRYTATRDIIDEDFGRQTRLFASLKKLKNDIDFLCADYRKYKNKNTKLHGINVFIMPFGIFYFLSFIKSLSVLLKKKKYNFLIATSDPLWGIIGYFAAKRHKIRFIYDLHDNYETYSTYKIPFLGLLHKYVVKHANIVTTVSHTLKNKIKKIRKDNVFVIQNGVDIKSFKPLNKEKCRKSLNLPKNAKIIAYAGSIQRLQGIDILIDAFEELKKSVKTLKLVVAGRFFKGEGKYIDLNQEGIIYLKSLSQDKVAELINAADIVVVPNPENAFTKYCFPYKVVEYMACNKPIVATNVGDVGILLRTHKEALCRPNDKNDMVKKIKGQIKKKMVNYRKDALKNSWDNIAKNFNKILKQ
jgi:glycosyltransferase involved in cell wall biosynthesis|tara:strand:- start:22939 stop:24030 length:1092 start_codon:yes stop_codon:yes gene_type:complete